MVEDSVSSISDKVSCVDGISVACVTTVLFATDAANDKDVATVVTTFVAATVKLLTVPDPSSIFNNASSPLKSGIKRVHQNAMRRLRSMRRCLRMNSTVRMKKTSPARIRSLSSQSDFSSAVMRCFEVVMRPSRTSCVLEVERNDAEEVSVVQSI